MSVLFLCVANAARSQLAEGLARRLLGGRIVVASAGSRPGGVHPMAIEVMREVGVDLSTHRSRSVDEVDRDGVELVITLCAEEVCPVWLGKARRLHWPLPDPARDAGTLAPDALRTRFRETRDELALRLLELVAGWPPDGVTLAVARADDLDEVRSLAAASALPIDGLGDQFPDGYVVARRGGALVGAAGLESHDGAGLLRSVVVAPEERGTGLGVTLTATRLIAARVRGLDAVYLLTTTAAAFYLRFGFQPFPRAEVPPAIAASPEFASICPSTAACQRWRA